MSREGHQPNKGKLDISNPPKGGSGVPKNIYNDTYKRMWEEFKEKYGEEYFGYGGQDIKKVMDEFEVKHYIQLDLCKK